VSDCLSARAACHAEAANAGVGLERHGWHPGSEIGRLFYTIQTPMIHAPTSQMQQHDWFPDSRSPQTIKNYACNEFVQLSNTAVGKVAYPHPCWKSNPTEPIFGSYDMRTFAKLPLKGATAGGSVALMFGVLMTVSPGAIASDNNPSTPAAVTPSSKNFPFLTAHAVGTQNYICLPDPANPGNTTWTFIAPRATLSIDGFSRHSRQVATHFLSTVPGAFPSASPGCTAANDANQQYCPTWQNSRDSSQIWGSRVGSVRARATVLVRFRPVWV